MCRWFLYCSDTEECLLEDVLVTPKHSLSNMINKHYLPGLAGAGPNDSAADKEDLARNLVLNVDGLGLAWYDGTRSSFVKGTHGPLPTVYKSISPPLNDYNYRSICANTATKLLFAHVRATSGSAVTQINCHPFVFGRHTFMHNGTVTNFVDIRRPLCELLDNDSYAAIAGTTDSEHVAALYISILTNYRGKSSWEEEFSCKRMADALRETLDTIIKLQKQVLGAAATPNSLNLAVADGVRVVAIRFRNHDTEQPPSLYWSTTAGVTLNRKYPGHPDNKDGKGNEFSMLKAENHGRHLIVASEPTTMQESEWSLVQKNHMVMFEKGQEVAIESFPCNEAWNVDNEEYAVVARIVPHEARNGACEPLSARNAPLVCLAS